MKRGGRFSRHAKSLVANIRIYHDLAAEEYANALQRAGLDELTAHFVAALDASIAHGDLETSSTDLPYLHGRAATGPTEIVRAAHERLKIAPMPSSPHPAD